ncbi:MAG TPA: Ppx/GppA phosphatase family protein [Gemmatimonadaceae bacterium]|nr:Ppx/GppA phosphatase family protein [Gemmatimonadaceae bacterium]
MAEAEARLRLVPPRRPRASGDVRISAIDIGSNSIRQIIADVSPSGGIRVVDEMKAAPRLGAGIHETGRLSDDAADAAIFALSRMASLADQLGARRKRVVATSAVREAGNGAEWLARVKKETGLKVVVLDGEDEARLAFRSAQAHFDLGTGRAVVMDIGGGSLEIALSADGLVDRLISLPLGAIRVTEKYFRDGIKPGALRKVRRTVRKRLRDALSARDWSGAQIIGSGGTFTNLAGMILVRQGTRTAQTVHGTVVSRTDLEHVADYLATLSPAERQTVPGLNVARSDIIVGGLTVVAEVLSQLDAREVVVSSYGIREGILLELANVSPRSSNRVQARQRSVDNLAKRSHYEEPHAKHVQKLALRLFDSIGEKLGCEPGERQTLADAALLHDIGYHINYDKHHKHSYHLITHAELLGMTPTEQVLIANVARYHRGATPRKSHENFGPLSAAARERVIRLAAMLRVADGFDRGHAAAVEEVRVRWLERALRLIAVPSPKASSIRLELWGASKKSALLSKVAGVPVEVVGPGGAIYTSEDDDSRSD